MPDTLILAAGRGDVGKVQQLVNNAQRFRRECRKSEPGGKTALHAACEGGHHAVLPLLLEHGKSLLDRCNSHGRTSLNIAADLGHLECVTALLHAGAQLDTPDVQGCTALMRACINGHAGVAELLLERGAQLDLTDAQGHPALYRAAVLGHDGIVEALLRRGAALQPTAPGVKLLPGIIGRATRNGHPECARLLQTAMRSRGEAHYCPRPSTDHIKLHDTI